MSGRVDSRQNVTGGGESFELRCLTIQVTQRSEELLEFDLNVFLQLERIQSGVFRPQLRLRRLRDVRTAQQPFIRRLRFRLLDPPGLPVPPLPPPQLELPL